MSDKNDENESQEKDRTYPPTILTWTVRGISLSLVLALLTYFTYGALKDKQQPTIDFQVNESKIELLDNGWAVPVTITNRGGRSLHNLVFKGISQNDGSSHTENITLAILGPNETASVLVYFEEDPRNLDLKFLINSYLSI